MRRVPGLLLLCALAACAGETRPAGRDDVFGRPPQASAAEEERRARAAIREIEDRVARGDLPKIQFEFDKDEIKSESHETLELIARVILSSDQLKLFIRAYTDDVGADGYNLDLSQRRAKAVSDYLADKGVHPPSMRYRGYGSARPIAENGTDAGRAKNRRVEFYVTTREWDAVY